MNLQEYIFNSKEIIEKIEAGIDSIKLAFLAKSLDIEISKVLELFEKENIVIDDNPNTIISSDLFRQILLKEPEISTSPKNLRDLLLTSKDVLEKLEQTDEFIKVIFLCKKFEMGIRSVTTLLKLEGIKCESRPTAKIRTQLLKQIIDSPNVKKSTDRLLEIKAEILVTSNRSEVNFKSVVLNQYLRNERIREYAKLRANGLCELCEKPAPFNDKYGNPFLETHHINYLSKGGQDTIENVAAICPNCHRKIHNLNLQSDIEKLKIKRN